MWNSTKRVVLWYIPMYRLHRGLLKEDVPNASMARACVPCMCSAASLVQSLDDRGFLVRCNEKAIQFSSAADIKIYMWLNFKVTFEYPGFKLKVLRNRLIRPITLMFVVYSQGSQRSFVCAAASGATLSLFIGQSCNSFCDTGEARKETCCEMEFLLNLISSGLSLYRGLTFVQSWWSLATICLGRWSRESAPMDTGSFQESDWTFA